MTVLTKALRRQKALDLIIKADITIEYYDHSKRKSDPATEIDKQPSMEKRFGRDSRVWKRRGSFQHMLDMQLTEML